MLFSGHALDEKAFPGNWPKAAATPERLFRARDVGVRKSAGSDSQSKQC